MFNLEERRETVLRRRGANFAMNGSAQVAAAGSPLVGAPLLPTMMRLAVPDVIGAMIHTLLIVVEVWFVSRAGTTV